jgi:uncharacterized protein YjiS (DUF1127 family)
MPPRHDNRRKAVTRLHAVAQPSTAPVSVTIGTLFLGLARRMTAAHARRRTERALSELDDAALKDIGLERSQIRALEHDPRYRMRVPRF